MNTIIYGSYDDNAKFAYIINQVLSKCDKAVYLCLYADEAVISNWIMKHKYLQERLSILNVKSGMLMEPFTIGHKENDVWISEAHGLFDVLIIEGEPDKVVKIEKIRKHWWAQKPLYILTHMSEKQAKDNYLASSYTNDIDLIHLESDSEMPYTISHLSHDQRKELAKAISTARGNGNNYFDFVKNIHGEHIPFYRASGNCMCVDCGRKYLDHPLDKTILDWDNEPWLNVLCNGVRVKL